MTIAKVDVPQGPFEGSRCVAGPGGRWGAATIRKVYEDGSFKIEFDTKEMVVLPFWYGVTPAEVSFNDALLWPAIFSQISPDGKTLAIHNFASALSSLGYQIPPDRTREFWVASCKTLFNLLEEQAVNYVLDESFAYQLFLHLGVSAKQCAEMLKRERPTYFFKLYWNQLRMGGRDPSEVARPVTLDDALAALGLDASRVNPSAASFLRQLEREQKVRLPSTFAKLLSCVGIANAVVHCHSNNPALIDFDREQWKVRRGMREQHLSGDCAMVFMVPHQGDHEWAIVFDDGEDDARIYVRWDVDDGESWLLTAEGIGMFFWDLAQTGFAWQQDVQFKDGKPVRRSDIGLVMDA